MMDVGGLKVLAGNRKGGGGLDGVAWEPPVEELLELTEAGDQRERPPAQEGWMVLAAMSLPLTVSKLWPILIYCCFELKGGA